MPSRRRRRSGKRFSSSSSLRRFSPQHRAGRGSARHQFSRLVDDVAFDHPHRPPAVRHLGPGRKLFIEHGPQEIDLELQRRERLPRFQRGRKGVPHRRVGKVAQNSAVHRSHRIVVPAIRLQLENGLAVSERYDADPHEERDRRRHRPFLHAVGKRLFRLIHSPPPAPLPKGNPDHTVFLTASFSARTSSSTSTPSRFAVASIGAPPPQQESTLYLLKIPIVCGYFLMTSLITMSRVIGSM